MFKGGGVPLRAPFPWFGGKSRAASLVWDRFGVLDTYIEPFAGSLAVLLARPNPQGREIVNDLDCFLSNFWRALVHDPNGLAKWADHPVNEADLHARHAWLVNQQDFRERMKTDPNFYDVKIAGWWVWGQSAWLAGGWCTSNGGGKIARSIPTSVSARGTQGVNSARVHTPSRSVPLMTGSMDAHAASRSDLQNYMDRLSARLRNVVVACGEWDRVLTPAVMDAREQVGIMLDPPYAPKSVGAKSDLYSNWDDSVSEKVRQWAIEHGDNRKLRIALCGYEGEHDMPKGWTLVHWKAVGGYGNQRKDKSNQNARRERIWFSPYCIRARLF